MIPLGFYSKLVPTSLYFPYSNLSQKRITSCFWRSYIVVIPKNKSEDLVYFWSFCKQIDHVRRGESRRTAISAFLLPLPPAPRFQIWKISNIDHSSLSCKPLKISLSIRYELGIIDICLFVFVFFAFVDLCMISFVALLQTIKDLSFYQICLLLFVRPSSTAGRKLVSALVKKISPTSSRGPSFSNPASTTHQLPLICYHHQLPPRINYHQKSSCQQHQIVLIVNSSGKSKG